MRLRYYRKFFLSIIAYCLVICFSFAAPALARESPVDIYFFHSKTCPHCLKQKPVMEKLAELNNDIELHSYEVKEQSQIWQDFLAKHQLKSEAVPRTLIGSRQFIGYSESDGKLEYNAVYQAYIGYQNQIIKAIETELGHPLNLGITRRIESVDNSYNLSLTWKILGLPILYLLV